MATKIDTYDYDLIENYYLQNLSANDFWLFASHDFEQFRPVSRNTEKTAREILEKTIFGIKYNLLQDFSFMIQSRLWIQNAVYDQYDDTSIIENRPFYIVTEPESESADYHVFKCISNNNQSPSTEMPNFNVSIQDGLYYLSDGYVWKYMTSIPLALFRKFATRGLLPIVRNQQVENVANEGIYNVVVENPTENNGYDRITGIVNSLLIQNGITRIFMRNLFSETNQSIPIFEVPNTYSNRAIYIEKFDSSEFIGAVELTILESGVLSGIPFVVVSTPDNFTIEQNDRIEILPKVIIEGDGTGASAIVDFDSSNQQIKHIKMLSFGQNYRSAIARVVDPIGFDPSNPARRDLRCVVRPIISPIGGHGSNVISELRSRHICLSKIIRSEVSNNVTSTGTYSKASLVKNPDFDSEFTDMSFDNRIKIELETIPSSLQIGSVVTQGNVRAKVHEIDEDLDTIFLVEYDGPYSETFVSNQPLQFENVNYDINNIEFSPYTPKTGTVLSIVDFTPIERDETKSEQIRIILDF